MATSAEVRRNLARREPHFVAAWSALPPDAQLRLSTLGLGEPMVWAALIPDGEGPEDFLKSTILPALQPLEGESTWDDLMVDLLVLAQSCGPAVAMQAQTAAQLSGHQVVIEHALDQRTADKQVHSVNLLRLEAQAVDRRPEEWRPAKLRRLAPAANEHERADAEASARKHWGLEVLGILREADLPYARQQKETGLSSELLAQRCCRGLRYRTLRKHTRLWRPFRRYLLGLGQPPFPTLLEQVLDYLALHSTSPTSWFRAFRTSLRFFEEAGERATADLLHDLPGLANTVAEAGATTAERGAPAPAPQARQAPPLLVGLLVALEHVVADSKQAPYKRLYAWVLLLRHWASLRWDDTLGLHPGVFKKRARGLLGVLERTKVSGPDKKVVQLPIFVSSRAWLSMEWLDAGHRLLLGTFGYKRDYLLPLATPDLQGCLQRRAEHSDSATYSRALFLSLETPTGAGTALLSPGCASFWTEHSARAGLDSWHAALGTELSQRNFLGRWAAKSSADSYVRTAVRVVERLQIAAAVAAARLMGGGQDAFGEEHVLEDMREHALRKGDTPEEIQASLTALTSADPLRFPDSPPHWACPPSVASGPSPTEAGDSEEEKEVDEATFWTNLADPPAAASEGSMVDILRGRSSNTLVLEVPDEQNIPTPVGAGDEAASDSDSSSPEAAELELAAESHEPREERAMVGFVIVKSRGLRRLHFAGRCAHLPRALHKEVWGEAVPPAAEYTAQCGTCFRRGEGPVGEAASSSSSGTDSEEE